MARKKKTKGCPRGMKVQTLIFPDGQFTETTAKRWAKQHGFKMGKVDETLQSFRLRQEDPSGFTRRTFRTLEFGDSGVKAVVACPRRKANPHPIDEDAATELELFVDNDAELYRQIHEPIMANLARKKARGTYDHKKAIKAYEHLMREGAKRYHKEFGTPDTPYHHVFDAPTRRHTAERFVDEFETEYTIRNQDARMHALLAEVGQRR